MNFPLNYYRVEAIGFIRHSYSDEYVSQSWGGVDADVEILPEYRHALLGIEGYSHLILVAYLHKVNRNQVKLVLKPMGLLKVGLREDELPLVGLFCTASPLRPNPIAVSIVELNDVEDGVLHISKCDLFNGTPVLDIKPFTPSRCPKRYKIPKWLEDVAAKARERAGIDIFEYC